MSDTPPLHDLVIRTVVEYLPCENATLCRLHRLNTRFYSIRDFFISYLSINQAQSLVHQDLWNKVYSVALNNPRPTDYSVLKNVRNIKFSNINKLIDLS